MRQTVQRTITICVIVTLGVGLAASWLIEREPIGSGSTLERPKQPQSVQRVAGVNGSADGKKSSTISDPPQPVAEEAKFEEREFQIVFPDGSQQAVTFRPWGVVEGVVGFEEIADLSFQYEMYRQRAIDGDVVAAMSLESALRECSVYGYPDEKSLTSAIDKLLSERVLETPSGETANFQGDQVLEEIELIKATAQRCKGITEEQIAEADDFLLLAYEQDSFHAINKVAVNSPPGKNKFLAWKKAWEQGDFNAPGWIGKGYRENWHGEGEDPVRSYAYALLAYELKRIAYSDRNGNETALFQRIAAASKHEERASSLSHEEYARAVDLAKSILASNTRCCMGLYMAGM